MSGWATVACKPIERTARTAFSHESGRNADQLMLTWAGTPCCGSRQPPNAAQPDAQRPTPAAGPPAGDAHTHSHKFGQSYCSWLHESLLRTAHRSEQHSTWYSLHYRIAALQLKGDTHTYALPKHALAYHCDV